MWTSNLIGQIDPKDITLLRSDGEKWISLQLKGTKSNIGFHDKEEFLAFVKRVNNLATLVVNDVQQTEEG